MKLLVLSDLHLGHPGWSGFGDKVLEKARTEAVDVLLFCGDLIHPQSNLELEDGFRRLQEIPAKHHLMVMGNNDIECLISPQTPLSECHHRLQDRAMLFGIEVLDFCPVVLDMYKVSFVGNFGAYDTSLWREPAQASPNFPSTKEDVLRTVGPKDSKVGADLGCQEFFALCQRRLHQHLATVNEVAPQNQLVVATHTVPSPRMLVYDRTPKLDYQNAWMGWDDDLSPQPIHTVPNLRFQFCGHTHRSQRVDRPGCPVPLINVSGQDQPHLFDV